MLLRFDAHLAVLGSFLCKKESDSLAIWRGNKKFSVKHNYVIVYPAIARDYSVTQNLQQKSELNDQK